MKKLFLPFLALLFSGTCMAQNLLTREFDYDQSGNRIIRAITLPSPSGVSSKSMVSENNNGERDDELRFEDKLGEFALCAYPNPTGGSLTVSIGNHEKLTEGKLRLFSANGQLLREYAADSPTVAVDLSAYSPGVYILTLQMNGRVKDWKIIKE